MKKKLIIGFLLCIAILAISPVSNATSGSTVEAGAKTSVNIDKSKYGLISPEKRAYTSKERVTFINGKAPAETKITIKIFGTTDLTRKNFNLHKLPKKDDYIEFYSDQVIAGNMGFFDKQLDLVSGINKITLNFNVEGVPNIELIVYVQNDLTKATKQIKISDLIPLMS